MDTRIRPVYVEFMPETLDDGVLYISDKYGLAVHRCCCGCGNTVVTPLGEGGWALTTIDGTVTLHPSIANRFPCQAHYWIQDSIIVWV